MTSRRTADDRPEPSGHDVPGPGTRPVARPVPTALAVALALVGLEALLLLAWAGWSVVTLVRGTTNPGGAAFLGAFALGAAVVLVLAGRACARRRRGGRAPLMTWQLLQAAVAVTLLQAGSAWGWLLLVPAAVVVVLLVSRPVVEHTVPR